MSHVFHRTTPLVPPVAVAGEGIWLIDRDGRRYLDASGGAAVSCLGHGHPKVTAALVEQAQSLAFAHTAFFTSEPAEALAELLIGALPESFGQVYLVSGGSEAVEAALKMARQYFLEIGEPQRTKFISRRQSYHGNTLGALAVGGNMWRREPYRPMLMDVSLIDPCFAYHFKRDDESEEAYARRAADALEDEILRLGPDTVIAFVAETVVGATAGAVTASPGYFTRIREICDRYGVLLILDEIMCGMGRTGTLFAFEQEGIAPDIVTIAKGLGGGYQPIGAAICSEKIYAAFAQGSGLFYHGHTYLGHPIACAAALAVQHAIRDDGLLDNVKAMGAALANALTERFGNHRHVGDIRGRGLFQAIEFVEDRSAKRPFDPAKKLHVRVKAEAMARGLIVYPMGGTIDGKRGDHVLLAPPFIVTPADIDTIVERLGDAVDSAIASVASGGNPAVTP